MIEAIITRVKEEIAIDGVSGTNIETVWKYVEKIIKEIVNQPGSTFTPVVDDRYRSFLWNYLRNEDNLEFYGGEISKDVKQEEAEGEGVEQLINLDPQEETQENATASNSSTNNDKDANKPDIVSTKVSESKPKSKPKPKPKPKTKAKSKPKPKKKSQKKTYSGSSDDDFEPDDDEDSESEFEESDAYEEASDDEDDDDKFIGKVLELGTKKIKVANKLNLGPKKPKSDTKSFNAQNSKESTRIKNIEDLSYEDVKSTYGDKLYVLASEKLQHEQLYIGVPHGISLSSNSLVIASAILKSRSKGLYQAEITKMLGLDSRSTGHFVKTMEEKGIIVRKGVSINCMFTNLCIHVRYNPENKAIEIVDGSDEEGSGSIPYNVNNEGRAFSQECVLKEMVGFLKNAPNQSGLSRDVLHGLGFDSSRSSTRKWFNRTLDELCLKGYIKKHNVKINNSGKIFRSIQLIKVPKEYNNDVAELDENEIEYPIRVPSTKEKPPSSHFILDLPIETQVSHIIQASGTQGIPQKDISFILNLDETRIISKVLDKYSELQGPGTEQHSVVRYMEFDKRVKRYRYYTTKDYRKKTENIEMTFPPQLDHEFDESECVDKDIFEELPHEAREFNRYLVKLKNQPNSKKSIFSKNSAFDRDPNEKVKKGRPKKTAVPKSKPAAKTSTAKGKGETNGSTENNDAEKSGTTDSANAPKPAKLKNPAASIFQLPPVKRVTRAVAASNKEDPITLSSESENEETNPKSTAQDPEIIKELEALIAEPIVVVPYTSKPDKDSGKNQTNPEKPSENEVHVEHIEPSSETVTAPSPSSKPLDATKSANDTSEGTIVNKDIVDSGSLSASALSESQIIAKNTESLAETPAKVPSKRARSDAGDKEKSKKKTITDYFFRASQPKKSATVAKEPIIEEAAVEEPMVEKTSDAHENPNMTAPLENADMETSSNINETGVPSENVQIEKSATDVSNNNLNKDKGDETDTVMEDLEKNPAQTNSEQIPEGITAETTNEDIQPVESTSAVTGTSSGANTAPTTEADKSSSNSTRIVTIKHQNKGVNAYLEIRIKVMQHILAKMPIVEMGKSLKILYNETAAELNYPTSSNMCSKTLWRTAVELSKRNLAKTDVVKCPLLNGKSLSRKLLVRIDIDLESTQYKNYVRYFRQRKAMHVISHAIQTLETVDFSSIETAEQRVERMKKEVAELKEKGEIRKAEILETRIDELSKNVTTFGQKAEITLKGSWIIRAMQYGWINAAMIRCKMFHLYLLSLLERDIPDTDKEGRILSIKSIINNMSLHLFCQIVGVMNDTEELSAYVLDSKNSSVLIDNLPMKIRVDLFYQQNRVRRRLFSLLRLMEFMGLVTPLNLDAYIMSKEDSSKLALAPEYKINKDVTIRDLKSPDKPVLREHTINNTSDAVFYWSELRYLSTVNTEEYKPEDIDPKDREYIDQISQIRNWSVRSVFTRGQKKFLNSYVDRVLHKTPLENGSLIRSIADALKISYSEVKSYYEKVETALRRKFEHNEYKRIERSLVPRMRRKRKQNDDRVISLSSTRAFKRIKSFSKTKTIDLNSNNTASNENDNDGDPKSDSETIDETMRKGLPFALKDSRLQRTKRTVWTPQEDEILIYVVVILRHRSRVSRFMWSATRSIFPERSPNKCRHRFSKLMDSPVHAEQYEVSTVLWQGFYEEGIESGEIVDIDPHENINFDFLSFLTYFIRRLTDTHSRNNPGHIALPQTPKSVHEKYDVVRSSMSSAYFEDEYHTLPTSVKRHQSLIATSLTVRKYDDTRFDQSDSLIETENNSDSRHSRLIRSFSLMALITPKELYDQFYCYTTLKGFSPALFDKTMSEMHKEGILIGRPGERPIPGTRLSLSAKFSDSMVGNLSVDLFKEAREYEEFLNVQEGDIPYSSHYASSGMMACLMNLLSSNRLSISFAEMNSYFDKISGLAVQARYVDKSVLNFDLKIKKIDHGDQFMPYIPQPDSLHLKTLSRGEFKEALCNLLSVEDHFYEKLLKEVIELLFSQAEIGCTLYQLKMKLDKSYTDEDIMRAIHKLCSNDPALVCRVGFEAVRYVHIHFVQEWAIVPRKTSIQGFSESTKNKLKEASQDLGIKERKPIIVPSLWTDINGNITELVYKECKQIIVDLVLRKPGITEADIHRQLKKPFSRREVRDLLNVLVDQQVLRQVRTTFVSEPKKKLSIFAKTRTAKCLNDNSIEKLTQSCFWVTYDTYNRMT